MATRSRNLLIGVFIVLLLIGGGLYYLGTNLNGIVAGLIESEGSAATRTAVRVNGVDIRLTEASASMSGLTVGNPEGFGGNALELGRLSLRIDAGTLTSDTVVVNDVTVAGARVNVLQQGASNNLRQLLANLKELRSADSASGQDGGRKIIIDRFTLEGAAASVSIPELDELREVELPTIVIRDIGRASNGATGAQVAQQVLRPVVEKALSSAAAQSLKDRAREELDEATGGLLEGLGNMLGGGDEKEEPR